MRTIFQEVEDFRKGYEQDTITIADGFEFNQGKELREVEFYSNSKYLGGDRDSLGRDKPFFNIVNANVDVAVVATDLDTKDIQLVSTSSEGWEKAFALSKEGQRWMRETNYAKHLNERGETRARYGGVVIKRRYEDNQLKIDVCVWKNLVTDPTNIAKGIKIERHWMSALDLSKKKGVWDNVEEAMKLARTAKKDGYKVEVLEIEGEFSRSQMTENESDEDNSSLQCHYLIKNGKKELSLYKEELKESNYKYLPWKKRPGNPEGLGIGIVKEGSEAQVWTNDAVLAERNVMDLAGKVVLYSDDDNLEGLNTITEIDNGSFIKLSSGRTAGQLNLTPSSLPQFQNLVQRWQSQFDRTTAVTDALRGETPPSGQAFRLQALVTNQSGSQFDYRREEAGIFEKEVWTDWIIPHLKKRLKKAHTLVSEFSKEELDKIDEGYINYLVKQEIERLVKGEPTGEYRTEIDEDGQEVLQPIYKGGGQFVDPMQVEAEIQAAKQRLTQTNAHRYLDVPQGYYDDLEVEVDVITTGEQKNKTAMLESMSNIFTTVASNPQILQDPVLSEIFYKIVETSGVDISPVTLAAKASQGSLTQGGVSQMVQGQSSLPDPNMTGPEATQETNFLNGVGAI